MLFTLLRNPWNMKTLTRISEEDNIIFEAPDQNVHMSILSILSVHLNQYRKWESVMHLKCNQQDRREIVIMITNIIKIIIIHKKYSLAACYTVYITANTSHKVNVHNCVNIDKISSFFQQIMRLEPRKLLNLLSNKCTKVI